MKKLIVALSICLVVLLGICVALNVLEAGEEPHETKPSHNEQLKSYTVRFEIAGNVISDQKVNEGQVPQTVSTQIQGLRFVSWMDKQGNPVDPFSRPVTADVSYQALVYPELRSHVPYLFADDEGYLRPDDVLTADELQMALKAMAAEGASAYFPELPLGPMEMTYGDVTELLASFYDGQTVNGAFSGHEGEHVTRSAFAQGMSQLLGYMDTDTVVVAPGTKIPADITQGREDAVALLQASIRFVVSEYGGAWTEIDLPVPYDPGFVNIDGWLYYVQKDHYFLKDDSVGTLYFGTDGRYTSGDATLDQTVATILDQIIKDNPDGSPMEILRDVYDHCHTQYTYRRTYDHPPFGGHGWEIQRANAMFETGKGNCYSYAAIFWALSRGLGYQTRAISGTCLSDEQPHSWCIIELDGEDYFFDPEWQYAYTERGVFDKDMFKIPMDKISYWGYKWTE